VASTRSIPRCASTGPRSPGVPSGELLHALGADVHRRTGDELRVTFVLAAEGACWDDSSALQLAEEVALAVRLGNDVPAEVEALVTDADGWTAGKPLHFVLGLAAEGALGRRACSHRPGRYRAEPGCTIVVPSTRVETGPNPSLSVGTDLNGVRIYAGFESG
jgi:hypothetical protein